jgi:hypothetical protein
MKPRLMYIELKEDGLRGPARIGRVTLSQTGKTLYYDGRTLAPMSGGLKANYFDTNTLEQFWISGPRADGCDSLYAATVDIDDDARSEYWRDIRKQPGHALERSYKSPGKSKKDRDAQEKGLRRRNMDRRWQPARFEATSAPTVDEVDQDDEETER